MACRVLECDYRITNSFLNHYNSVVNQKTGWAIGSDIIGLQKPICNVTAHSEGTVIKVVDYMDDTNLKNDREGWGFGNYVIILHGQRADGKWLATEYCHLAHVNDIKEGQKVTKGQILGLIGNTGMSYGAHLHWSYRVFSVKPTKENVHDKNIFVWENPEQYINKDLPLMADIDTDYANSIITNRFKVKVNDVQKGAFTSYAGACTFADNVNGVVIDGLTDKQIYIGKTTEDYSKSTIPNRFRVMVNSKQIGAYTFYAGAVNMAKEKDGVVLDGSNVMKQLYP